MTRKIKYLCGGGGLHHLAASISIEECGLTKKYLLTEGFRREFPIESDGWRQGEAETWCELVTDENMLIVKTFVDGCITRWRFTYPALRLVSYQLTKCSCDRKKQTDHDF